jgi:hypothetical protein
VSGFHNNPDVGARMPGNAFPFTSTSRDSIIKLKLYLPPDFVYLLAWLLFSTEDGALLFFQNIADSH